MKKLVTRTLSLCAIVLPLAFLLVSAKADKIVLQYNLTKGSTYKLKTVADQIIEQSMMGQTQTIKNHIEAVMAFQVQSIEGNVFTIETWYEKLKMVMETPMGKQEMDSEQSTGGNPGSETFAKIVNKRFVLKMTNKGEITEVNSEKLLEEMTAGLDDQQGQLKESMKQYLGKDALKSSIEMMSRCFPANPVEVGDSWTQNTELLSVMTADVVMNWRLTGRNAGTSSLEASGTIKSKENNPFIKMNGYPMKFDILGQQQVQTKIDEKTGWIIESINNSEINGKAIVDASSQGAGTMEIPMKIISKTIVTGTN